MKTIQLSSLYKNPENPRFIKDEDFKKLRRNIRRYPNILSLRPIVILSWHDRKILGGNMRYEGLLAEGYTEVPENWIRSAEELTAEEVQAFIILDNTDFGDWDFDALANNWNMDDLNDWGVDIPKFEDEEVKEEKELKDLSGETGVSYKIEIDCDSELQQEQIFYKLSNEGYKCRVLTL
jgi:hypothetical protein